MTSTQTFDERLLRAAAIGNASKVLQALTEGANVQATTPDEGDTALHLVCDFGHQSCIEVLIKSGIDVNIKNRSGRTAAHEAVVSARAMTLYELIKLAGNELDWTARDKQGRTIEETSILYLPVIEREK